MWSLGKFYILIVTIFIYFYQQSSICAQIDGAEKSFFVDFLSGEDLVDAPVHIVIHNVTPKKEIMVGVVMKVTQNLFLQSAMSFISDGYGNIDLSNASSLSGNYVGVSGMGWYWSMNKASLEDEKVAPLVAEKNLSLYVYAYDGQNFHMSSILHRRICNDDISYSVSNNEGGVYTTYYPKGSGPFPLVVILPGAGSGGHEALACLLASKGYVASSVRYFGLDPLPKDLINIPLEYFRGVLDQLHQDRRIKGRKTILLGFSRGAELALLLGSHFSDIGGVVAYSPSSVVNGAYATHSILDKTEAAWTFHGDAITPLEYDNKFISNVTLQKNIDEHESLDRYIELFKDERAVVASSINIESIDGPLLLVSGRDDRVWPSSKMAEMILARAHAYKFPYKVESLIYENAGHAIKPPLMPVTLDLNHVDPEGRVFSLGGSPQSLWEADTDSWRHVLDFLGQFQ